MGWVGGRSWFAKSDADLYASSASDALALRSSADWNSARYLLPHRMMKEPRYTTAVYGTYIGQKWAFTHAHDTICLLLIQTEGYWVFCRFYLETAVFSTYSVNISYQVYPFIYLKVRYSVQ